MFRFFRQMPSLIRVSLFVAFAFFAISHGWVRAQDGKESEIRGVVLNQDGQPAVDAEIYTYEEIQPEDVKTGWETRDHLYMYEPGKPIVQTVRVLSKTKSDKKGQFKTALTAKFCKLRIVPVGSELTVHGVNQKTPIAGKIIYTEAGGVIDLGTLKLAYQGTNPQIRVKEPKGVLGGMFEIRTLYLRKGLFRPVDVFAGFQGELRGKDNKLLVGRSVYLHYSNKVLSSDRQVSVVTETFPATGRTSHLGGLIAQPASVESKGKKDLRSKEQNLPVSEKTATLSFRLKDSNGKAVEKKTTILLNPLVTRGSGILPNKENLSFTFPLLSVDTNDNGIGTIDIPYGKWSASAVIEGIRYTINGKATTALTVDSKKQKSVDLLPAPKGTKTGSLFVEISPTFLGHNLESWADYYSRRGAKPLTVGIYLAPSIEKEAGVEGFYIQSLSPNYLFRAGQVNEISVKNIPVGKYLVFLSGSVAIPSMHKEFEYPLLVPDLFPICVAGTVSVVNGETAKIKIRNTIKASDYAKWKSDLDGTPISVLKRELAYKKKQVGK